MALLTSAQVITDRETGRSKGFGFIEMPDNAEADQAIKAFNGYSAQRPADHRESGASAQRAVSALGALSRGGFPDCRRVRKCRRSRGSVEAYLQGAFSRGRFPRLPTRKELPAFTRVGGGVLAGSLQPGECSPDCRRVRKCRRFTRVGGGVLSLGAFSRGGFPDCRRVRNCRRFTPVGGGVLPCLKARWCRGVRFPPWG